MTLTATPDVSVGPVRSNWAEVQRDAAPRRLAGPDVDLAERAIMVAGQLPSNGPELILASVAGVDARWSALAGAKTMLRAIALADPGELLPLVALALVDLATKVEVDHRRAGAGKDDE